MTVGYINSASLAPLDELIAICPRIQRAKDLALLGDALLKATSVAERYSGIPDRLEDLCVLLDATVIDKTKLRLDLGPSLDEVIWMGRILAGELSSDRLIAFNQDSMPQLPLYIKNIERQIEEFWGKCVEDALGGQAALGKVLITIPGIEALGSDVAGLASRLESLKDENRPANERVSELNMLRNKVSAMDKRLLKAGIAAPIADFLVAVSANPVLLSDFTEEIFRWIKENKASALFSISTRRS